MAQEKAKKRRVVKKSETVREKRQQAAVVQPKKRRASRAASKARTPFRALGKLVRTVLKPFGFLLWPFKTRPVRFVGRILSKVLLINYIRASWNELRLVEWPDRKTTFKLTLAVFAFAFTFGSFVAIADFFLDKIFKEILT